MSPIDSNRRTNSADVGFEIVQSFRGRGFSANHLGDGGTDRFRAHEGFGSLAISAEFCGPVSGRQSPISKM